MPPSRSGKSQSPTKRKDGPAAAPPGWITREELVRVTGISGRNLLQWVGEGLLPRPRRVSLGAKGTAAFYRAETVAMIRRLHELQRQTRDVDAWLWGLWLDTADFPAAYDDENSCLSVKAWAVRRLDVASETLAAAEKKFEGVITDAPTPGRNSAARTLRARLNEPDLHALMLWAAATAADHEQHERLDNPGSPVLDILRSATGLPEKGFPAPDRRLGVELMSITYLRDDVLKCATDEELEQARRDWRAIARLAEAAEKVDWNAAMPVIAPIIQSLTGERPEPPSIQARKVQRKRPPVPRIVRLLISLWHDLDLRAFLLAGLISFRRAPEYPQRITELLALAEWALAQFPRLDEQAS